MWHRYLVAFELALMGTGKFFEGILIVENTSTGAHRSSDPLTIVLQYCDERWVSMTCRAGVGDGRSPLRSRGWAWAKREMFNIQFKKTRVSTQGSKKANVEGFALQNVVFGLVIQ